jgi:hypothetical protein
MCSGHGRLVLDPIAETTADDNSYGFHKKPNVIDDMKAKIDTLQGKQIYARRLAIVEAVFANICVQMRLNRFTLRTKSKVDVQWRLFARVHKIGKIHTYGIVN